MTHAPLLTNGSPALATGEARARSQVLRPVPDADSAVDSADWCVPGADFAETSGVELGGVSPVEEAASEIVGMLDNWVTPDEVADLGPAELIGVARVAEVLSRKLDGLKVVAAAELQARDAAEPRQERLSTKLGCRNTVELLQRVTLVSAREVKRRLRLGNVTHPEHAFTGGVLPGKYPVLTTAIHSGGLSIDAGLLIANALQGAAADTSREFVAGAERSLVAAATGIPSTHPDDIDQGSGEDPADDGDADADAGLCEDRPYFAANHADVVREMAQMWEQAMNQDGRFTEREILQRRGLSFGQLKNGLIPVRGALLPETATLLTNVIDAINSPRTDTTGQLPNPWSPTNDAAADTSTASDAESSQSRVRFVPVENSAGSDTVVDIDYRTPDQKRHDAFATLVTIASQHEDVPAVGGAPVTVLMQVDADQIDTDGTIQNGWIYGPEGGPIPATGETIRHAACSGAVQRVVQDENGRIVELGNLQRVFNAHQRRAITLRDGGCVIPGCMTPARWCEVHHVHEHSRGGPTHTDNGVLVCFFHHRALETGGWEIRMPDGSPEVRAPGWLDPSRTWRKARSRTKPPGVERLIRAG